MSALSNINDLLLDGRLMDAVDLCKQSIKAQPSKIEPRVALYELSVFLAEWDRCQNQVEAIMNLGGDPLHWLGHMANIQAARERSLCWQGRKRPPVVGDCDADDLSMFDALWHAVGQQASGDTSLMEAIATTYGGMVFGPGKINGVGFDGISTVDSRLPGVVEISDGGEYAWLWLGAVTRIEMQGGAKNLSEVAWIPGRVFLSNGEVKAVSIFGLYPETEKSGTAMVMLGKATEWDDAHEALALGKGGQLLYVDERPIPFQQIRLIEFDGGIAAEPLETE